MAGPSVTVDFLADTSGLSKGIGQAEGAAKGFGGTLKGIAKGGALAAGAAGVGALVATLKIGVGEFQEAQKVGAQTEAVIKSTGGAANVSADQVSSLAESLMKKSGVDDEAIASGENLLLTFTNIRNEAGKGNDIFNQTTAAALDMSVALGTDMKTASMQLGKALNDPVKGMTKLTKSGVTFTEAQKEQVKAMVEAGDTMGAQKIILGELNKEFGGSAEAVGKTLPGQISILKESFNNFAGELVAKMVPALETAIGWLRDHWPQIQAALSAFWSTVQPILSGLADLFMAIVGVIRDHWGTIGPIVENVANAFKAAGDIIAGVIRLIVALIHGDWAAAWQALKDIVDAAVRLVVSLVKAQLGVLEAYVTGVWNAVKAVSTAAWNAIKGAAEAAWNGIKTAISNIVNAIKSDLTDTWNDIRNAVASALNATKSVVESVWNAIRGFIAGVVGGIVSAMAKVIDAFKKPGEAAQDMLGQVKDAFNGIVDAIMGVVGAVGRAAQAVADAMMKPINVAKGAINAVLSSFNALRIPGFDVTVPVPGPAPDIKFGWGGMDLPDIPLLAKGGVVSRPTLAMIGEGRGREIVTPERLLRSIMGEQPVNVRVFIGDTELKGLVRAEVNGVNTGIARTLLAGARG